MSSRGREKCGSESWRCVEKILSIVDLSDLLLWIANLLLLVVTKNQITIFPSSRSSLSLLCFGGSQLKPRRQSSPCSVWNSQLSTGLDR
jgi:hypothetical protein